MEEVRRKKDQERRAELEDEEVHLKHVDEEFFPNEPPKKPTKAYNYENALSSGEPILSSTILEPLHSLHWSYLSASDDRSNRRY